MKFQRTILVNFSFKKSNKKFMKSFLILFGGHVGSSWLCSMLNSHDENFHVAFEPFMQIQHKRKNNKIDKNLEKKSRINLQS